MKNLHLFLSDGTYYGAVSNIETAAKVIGSTERNITNNMKRNSSTRGIFVSENPNFKAPVKRLLRGFNVNEENYLLNY